MSQLSIQTDVVTYRRQVERLAQVTGLGLSQVMRQSVSIMAGQLARRFPPKSVGMGKRAIANDVNRILIRSNDVRTTREMDTGHAMIVFKNDAVIRIPESRYKPSASTSEIKAFHDANRVGPRRRTAKRGFQNRRVDGWTQSEKMFVPNAAAKSYIKTLQESVGKLKARWTRATILWTGAAPLPAWITKHQDKGNVRDAMKPNGDGFIEITNTAPYASQWQDINNFVVKSQGRMLQSRIRGELRKQANEHNRRSA